VQAIAATLRLSTSASVNASASNGWRQLSSVKAFHCVLRRLDGSLKLNTAMVTSGTSRYSIPTIVTTHSTTVPGRVRRRLTGGRPC
jgi:hypothetical protein